MSISIGANGNSYAYPQTDDTLWGDDATNWASAVSAALGALGLGASVNSKAVVDMVSTTKGALLPRMTTAQRDAITSVPTGLLIYNTTTNEFNVYTGSAWFGLPVRDTLTSGRILQWDGSKIVDSSLTASGSDLTIAGNFTAQIITANTRFVSPVLRAASSAGVAIQNNTGTEVASLGAGGGTGATFQGGVNIVGLTSVADGTIASPGLHFGSDPDTGLFRSATNQLDIVTGGQSRFRVEATGQIKAVYESQVGTDYNTTLHNGYLCRAWANFNGTGTAAIRASGNVSTLTDHGTGDISVNFTVALPDDNYAMTIGQRRATASASIGVIGAYNYTTSSARIQTYNSGFVLADFESIELAVFR
jgi:hypothetical protein